MPIFTFLLAARFLPHEHVGAVRIAGVGLGFLGVAALAGLDAGGGWWIIAGTLAVVLSSLSYAAGGVYGQLQIRDIPGPVLATGNMLAAAVVLLPLTVVDPPREVPGSTAPSRACSASSSSRRSPASCCSSASSACTAAGSSRS